MSSLDSKVDNTGNISNYFFKVIFVGTWPSEELLAYYLIQEHKTLINNGSSIIELGAGQSGLAGFALGTIRDDLSLVEITDGNSQCVKSKEFLNFT